MSVCRSFLMAALLAATISGAMAADEPAPVQTPSVATPVNAAPPANAETAVTAAATADTQTTTAQPATPKTASGPSTAARPAAPVVGASTSGMISGFIFLLALVLGAAWLVKRSGGMPALRGGSSIKIVAALSLGPRERVVLIEVGGQQWLLGVGGGAVNALHHFEQPIVAAGTDDFAGKLRQFLPQGMGR